MKFEINIISNKKAVSIPILILVLSALVLITTSLFYFNIKARDIEKTVKIHSEIDKIYLKEALLNFYLEEIFDKSIGTDNKQGFIENFKKELNNYKDKYGNYPIEELKQVENKIVEENIELNEDKLILKFDLELKQYYLSEKQNIIFSYNYKKEFQKVFK